jgi:hypothetical protein
VGGIGLLVVRERCGVEERSFEVDEENHVGLPDPKSERELWHHAFGSPNSNREEVAYRWVHMDL